MSRYFFHKHECGEAVMHDLAGREAADLKAARFIAVEEARLAMQAEIGRGKLCLSCWIVIANAEGHNLSIVHFGEAIQLVEHPSCEASVQDQRRSNAG